MRSHPLIRAYMAGILLPAWFLLIVLAVFLIGHFTGHVPPGIDSFIIVPVAVVPNVWGIWNVLYVALGLRQRISIGVFGALLPPALLVTVGLAANAVFHLHLYSMPGPMLVPVVMAIYYLAWKYGVGFLNRVVELR